MDEKVYEFEGTISRNIYDSDGFKIYAVDIDTLKYPNIKRTKYGNVSIKGDLPNLSEGTRCTIKATQEQDIQYGYSYKVLKVSGNELQNGYDMFIFLQEILTFDQAKTLYQNYPDIVQIIRDGKQNEVDLSKLKGIGEISFNRIVNKINENYVYADIISEFHGLFSYSVLIKLAEKYTSPQRIKEILKKDPYKFLTSIDRVGFKKADKMILEFEKKGVFKADEPLISSKQRCLAFIKYTLKQNEADGNTKINIKTLQDMCKKEVKESALHFIDCLQLPIIHTDKYDKSVSLQSTYNIESEVANRIKEGLSIENVWDIDIEPYRTKDNMSLTDEQMNSINNLCKYNISILDGAAGSGKSQSTERAVQLLKDNKKSYILLAPTGRASKVIAEYTHEKAYTIHRGLGYNPMEGWSYNKENPIRVDVVIVDEFSMVDIFLFKHLLDAIDFNKTKLLMIGDSSQLNSVSAGNCLHNMLDSKIVPETTLTKIFRYSDGGLMTIATDTRLCKPFLNPNKITSKATMFGSNKDYTFIRSRNETIIKDTLELYKMILSKDYKPEDVIVLSAYNKGEYGTVKLNKLLQKIANPNANNPTNGFKQGQKTFFVGDLVLQTVNNYKSKVYNMEHNCIDIVAKDKIICNGEIGKVVKILTNGLVIKFDEDYIFYERKALESIQLGYSVSIHKMQGGSAKVVIMVTPSAHQFMLSSNLLYVGLTRMKEKCYQLGDVSTINRAVKKKENLKRMTYLLNLLSKKI